MLGPEQFCRVLWYCVCLSAACQPRSLQQGGPSSSPMQPVLVSTSARGIMNKAYSRPSTNLRHRESRDPRSWLEKQSSSWHSWSTCQQNRPPCQTAALQDVCITLVASTDGPVVWVPCIQWREPQEEQSSAPDSRSLPSLSDENHATRGVYEREAHSFCLIVTVPPNYTWF